MNKKMILKRRSAFTLIETIVAFAIIGVILVVALAGFNTIASVGNRAQEWNLADQSLEDLIASGAEGENRDGTVSIVLRPGDPGADPPVLPIVINGVLRTYTDPASGKTITIFVPDDEDA